MKPLLTPHVTEKSYAGISDEKGAVNTYTFKVGAKLNQVIIKRIIEREFKVNVTDMRIVNLPAKLRKFKGIQGKTSVRRKVIVRLQAGQKIAAFDLPDQKSEGKDKE
jgi:large subunit ribosomal protein L23